MELKTQAQEGQNGQLSAVGAVLDLKTGLEGHGGEWARGVGGGGRGVGAHEQLSWMFNSQGTEAVSKAHGLDSGKP